MKLLLINYDDNYTNNNIHFSVPLFSIILHSLQKMVNVEVKKKVG